MKRNDNLAVNTLTGNGDTPSKYGEKLSSRFGAAKNYSPIHFGISGMPADLEEALKGLEETNGNITFVMGFENPGADDMVNGTSPKGVWIVPTNPGRNSVNFTFTSAPEFAAYYEAAERCDFGFAGAKGVNVIIKNYRGTSLDVFPKLVLGSLSVQDCRNLRTISPVKYVQRDLMISNCPQLSMIPQGTAINGTVRSYNGTAADDSNESSKVASTLRELRDSVDGVGTLSELYGIHCKIHDMVFGTRYLNARVANGDRDQQDRFLQCDVPEAIADALAEFMHGTQQGRLTISPVYYDNVKNITKERLECMVGSLKMSYAESELERSGGDIYTALHDLVSAIAGKVDELDREKRPEYRFSQKRELPVKDILAGINVSQNELDDEMMSYLTDFVKDEIGVFFSGRMFNSLNAFATALRESIGSDDYFNGGEGAAAGDLTSMILRDSENYSFEKYAIKSGSITYEGLYCIDSQGAGFILGIGDDAYEDFVGSYAADIKKIAGGMIGMLTTGDINYPSAGGSQEDMYESLGDNAISSELGKGAYRNAFLRLQRMKTQKDRQGNPAYGEDELLTAQVATNELRRIYDDNMNVIRSIQDAHGYFWDDIDTDDVVKMPIRDISKLTEMSKAIMAGKNLPFLKNGVYDESAKEYMRILTVGEHPSIIFVDTPNITAKNRSNILYDKIGIQSYSLKTQDKRTASNPYYKHYDSDGYYAFSSVRTSYSVSHRTTKTDYYNNTGVLKVNTQTICFTTDQSKYKKDSEVDIEMGASGAIGVIKRDDGSEIRTAAVPVTMINMADFRNMTLGNAVMNSRFDPVLMKLKAENFWNDISTGGVEKLKDGGTVNLYNPSWGDKNAPLNPGSPYFPKELKEYKYFSGDAAEKEKFIDYFVPNSSMEDIATAEELNLTMYFITVNRATAVRKMDMEDVPESYKALYNKFGISKETRGMNILWTLSDAELEKLLKALRYANASKDAIGIVQGYLNTHDRQQYKIGNGMQAYMRGILGNFTRNNNGASLDNPSETGFTYDQVKSNRKSSADDYATLNNKNLLDANGFPKREVLAGATKVANLFIDEFDNLRNKYVEITEKIKTVSFYSDKQKAFVQPEENKFLDAAPYVTFAIYKKFFGTSNYMELGMHGDFGGSIADSLGIWRNELISNRSNIRKIKLNGMTFHKNAYIDQGGTQWSKDDWGGQQPVNRWYPTKSGGDEAERNFRRMNFYYQIQNQQMSLIKEIADEIGKDVDENATPASIYEVYDGYVSNVIGMIRTAKNGLARIVDAKTKSSNVAVDVLKFSTDVKNSMDRIETAFVNSADAFSVKDIVNAIVYCDFLYDQYNTSIYNQASRRQARFDDAAVEESLSAGSNVRRYLLSEKRHR